VINDYCPHCEKPCVSLLRKLYLFPGATARCMSCGEAVSVPIFAVVSIFPLLMAYMIVFMAPGGELAMRAIVAGVLVGFAAYFQVFLLPLVAR